MRYGVMTSPPFAIAAETMATWSGVTVTLPCPIADSAVCAPSSAVPSRSVGNWLCVTFIGIVRSVSKPNFTACSWMASAPRSMPSCPNAVLQETRSASASVVDPVPEQLAPPKLPRTELDCGSWSWSGAGISLSGVRVPDSSAAAAVTSLNVDPGGYVSPAIVRLKRGSPSSATRAA